MILTMTSGTGPRRRLSGMDGNYICYWTGGRPKNVVGRRGRYPAGVCTSYLHTVGLCWY